MADFMPQNELINIYQRSNVYYYLIRWMLLQEY